MKIRAVAAPSPESNAVGTLELECLPQGLHITHLGISAYRKGYAPIAVTQGTSCLVPWAGLKDKRRFGNTLFLGIDKSLTPHHKLCLTNLRNGESEHEPEQRRRRWMLRIAAVGLALMTGFALYWQAPLLWGASVAPLALGIASGALVLLLGLGIERGLIRQPGQPPDLMGALIAELNHYCPEPVNLGFRPKPVVTPKGLLALLDQLPRSTIAIVILLSASSLSLVLTSDWLLTRNADRTTRAPETEQIRRAPRLPTAKPLVSPAPAAPTAAARTVPRGDAPNAADEDTVVLGAGCRCARPESALWNVAIPRISTLLIEKKRRQHKDHEHLELELAVVNNGDVNIPEVSLMVQFFEDKGNTQTKGRPLFYPGRLEPGQAIKWHVEARGTSFVVNNPITDLLTPDSSGFARPEQLAALLSANHRPVRLHGAMLLALHGDPLAVQGLRDLRENVAASETPFLDRIERSLKDPWTCDWTPVSRARVQQVEACVYNASGRRLKEIGLKARALEFPIDPRNPTAEPPPVLVERTFRVLGQLDPQSGKRVKFLLDTDNPDGRVAGSYELYADKYDLLY